MESKIHHVHLQVGETEVLNPVMFINPLYTLYVPFFCIFTIDACFILTGYCKMFMYLLFKNQNAFCFRMYSQFCMVQARCLSYTLELFR